LSDFDVIVVGGGCSGLWASVEAARGGAKTLLVDRSSSLGERIVCAEGVGAPGISQFIELEPEWIASEVNGADLYTPEGKRVEVEEPGCGFILHKKLLVRGLAEKARQEGVEIWTESEAVGISTGNGEGLEVEVKRPSGMSWVSAGAAVAADGIESRIGRLARIQSHLKPGDMFSCAQHTVGPIDLRPGRVEFHFGGEVAPGGYAWVFPKGESTANVGVGVVYDSHDRMASIEYLDLFMKKRCPEASVMNTVFGGVPSVKAPHKAYGNGVFLAGDSARVAEPLSGAGIVPGMESGALAARAASSHARGGLELKKAEREFVKGMKALFKDRNLRFAVRRVVTRMSDKELCRMIELTGEYAAGGSILRGDPFKVVAFVVRAMPKTFGLVRHLVGV
jgi:digeranylgeranylglycerophospholipid reductase